MVTFEAAGRMGNFLFECATALSYSLKHNLEFTVPFKATDEFWSPIYLKHLQNQNWDNSKHKIDIWENGHQWQEIPFEEGWRENNIVIHGYRQSAKYFDEHRSEILYIFNLPYEKKEGIVGVHVRRGDYVHLRDKHPEVSKEWYENAMMRFPGYRFKFFSDDISWCRKEFGSRQDCEFSTNDNIERDMIELSCCEHQIISSSTFGWWGGWLNRNDNKRVLIPKLWFVEGYSLETKDIVPEYFEKI